MEKNLRIEKAIGSLKEKSLISRMECKILMHTNMESQTELVSCKANMDEFWSREKASIERIKALENALASLREMTDSNAFDLGITLEEELQESHSEIKEIIITLKIMAAHNAKKSVEHDLNSKHSASMEKI